MAKNSQSSALKTVEIGSVMAVMDGQPEDDEQNASKDWNQVCGSPGVGFKMCINCSHVVGQRFASLLSSPCMACQLWFQSCS